MDNVLEIAQRMVDKEITKAKEIRKNSGKRCLNCKGVIKFSREDTQKWSQDKKYCKTCYNCIGSYDFKCRENMYEEVNGKWKKVKKLSSYNIYEY